MSGIHDDEDAVTEYEVVWFPNGPDGRLRTYDEDKAHKKFDGEKREGTNPILSSRRIIAGPWHVDANAAIATVGEEA